MLFESKWVDTCEGKKADVTSAHLELQRIGQGSAHANHTVKVLLIRSRDDIPKRIQV